MTKKSFIIRVIISTLVTLCIIAVGLTVLISRCRMYYMSSDADTRLISGTVTDVYYLRNTGIKIELSDGQKLDFIFSPIETLFIINPYDADELFDLLEGKTAQFTVMKDLLWILKIQVGDREIDNTGYTVDQLKAQRVAGVIIISMYVILIVVLDVFFLQSKYGQYSKFKRKQIKKEKRKLQLLKKYEQNDCKK